MSVSDVEVDPGDLDVDAGALAAVDTLILRAIADSATPGAVLAVGRRGGLARLRGYGRLGWADADAVPDERSIYDMASVTKVVGTTTAVMLLVDQGRLDLDAPVIDYLPWWADGDEAKRDVTVRHLLLHRAGLAPFRRFYFEIEGENAYKRAIAAEALDYEPGTRTVYSDIGVMTLAFIVEALAGQTLDAFLAERVFEPLGMEDTGFLPDDELLPRIAPTEVDTVFRHTQVHGVVHDENAYAIGGVAGHAGLFSTAADLSAFAQMMLNGGVAGPCPGTGAETAPCTDGDPRLIRSETFAEFTTRYDDSASRALGWDTPSGRSSAGDYFTGQAFGHTGYTGTSVWIDPELDVFVVLLTTRVNPTRDNSKHVPLRRSVHDIVAGALTDRSAVLREPAGSQDR
jgi:CubicO group peptidase (beta-lactamase class C family)